MDGHRVERADEDDPKAASKSWPNGHKPRTPIYNVPWSCAQREIGNVPRKRGTGGPPQELQWAAEDELISKAHEEFQCQLPSTARSTFLMVFSPDGTKVASTHGDHNVYVTDLPSGKGVRKLSGHPRTPWCLAFHPSSNQILASGCLGGQVRVWDLHGGSELWTAESHTVIASLAFHPTDRLLVVATYNELHFWDWSQPVPFAKCFTASEKEKVRYVTFDPLGHKLITGIANRTFVQSQWDRIPVNMSSTPSSPVVTISSTNPSSSSIPSTSSSSTSRPQPSSSPPPQAGRAAAASSSTSNVPDQERRITVCYRSLVEQYEQLVQRYYDLSRAQAAASAARVAARGGMPSTSGTASFASTTDRGTDPMEPESASTASPPTSNNDDRSSNLSSDNPSASSRLDSLRANLRRFQQPSFLSMTGFQRRILRTAASRLTHQVEDVSDRVDDEISGGQSRRVVAQGELMVRMVSSPCPERLTVRLRSMAAVTVPSTSATPTSPTTTTSAPSNTSTPTTNARPFASVRSAFRPRLASSRAPDQAALDLRVRSCQSTAGSTSTVSTFSTSLRSAFQPRTSTTRSGSSATRGSSSGRQGCRFSSPPADVSVRFGIQLLSRHIDNMQRLCRARLEILQLQQIRRMWEDLQRQIGSLHAAVRDGNSSAIPASPTASSLFPNSPPAATTSPPSSPPPRPSRPPLPPSPPPLPPPPLSSPSSGEDDGGEPSGGASRAEDEEEGLRVRELMELARISGGEEPDSSGGRGGGSEEGAREVGGDSGGVSSGMAGAPFRDRPGNQTSRKRARIPVRFPEPGPNRPLRLFARISTGTRPANRGRPAGYSSLLGRLIARPQRRLPSLRVGRCGPPYVCLQRLPEGVVSAAVAAGQLRSDLERSDWQPETGMSNDVERDINANNVSQERNPGDPSPDNSSNQDVAVAVDPIGETQEEESAPRVPDTSSSSAAAAEPSNTDSAPVPGPSSSPTSSQINSFRQAGEDFHGRFCSMISRLEVLVRQQRENREAYWRARRNALWTRREAGRPEGGGRGSSEANRGPSDCPIFTLSDSSSDESDSSNVASPLARRIQLLKQHYLRERQRRAWRREMAENEGRLPSSVAPTTSEPPSSSPPPSTSSQLPPSTSSSLRDEPSTSSGAPSDAEWQWTRESTRLRARQVLSMMVESLTQFFEQHGLSQDTPHAILDEQIYNLYVLLQLALELTDLLLIQLMSTRRELEEQWVNTLRGPNSEGNNAQDSSRRTAPCQTRSPSTSQLQGPRLFRALPRPFPRSRGTTEPESSQQPSVDSVAGVSSEEPPSSRPRQSFTVPEVQVNDVPVAPEAVSLLGEPPGGRARARSPPPPGGIFVPVGSPRSMPMSGTTTSSSRRGRPNPFVQLHQLRRLGGSGGSVGAGVGGNGSGGTGDGRFRRFLHPRYVGPNPLGDEYREDPLQETMENILRGTFLQDSVVLADASMSLTHRIQAWDFSSCTIPEIGDGEQNVVVPECKIHNDASVDVSSDGRMLVTLLPPGRLQINTMLGIYSLEWGNLGECLFIMSLAQNAVSVSLSPTCRHLAVGLASRRVALLPSDRHTMAQLFRLDSAPPYPSPPPSASSKGKGIGKGMRRGASNTSSSTPNSSQVIGHLHHVRDIDQGRGQGYVSLNCIRWMPGAGQGLVYGTNTGQLKVLR